jgi:hypothetical protein
MTSIESPPCTGNDQVSGTRTVSGRAVEHPAHRAWRMLCGFLAGLDQLLKLGDFSRGDWFRD